MQEEESQQFQTLHIRLKNPHGFYFQTVKVMILPPAPRVILGLYLKEQNGIVRSTDIVFPQARVGLLLHTHGSARASRRTLTMVGHRVPIMKHQAKAVAP